VLFLALAYLLNQVRRPSRWIGRWYLWLMNRSHSDTILDAGCGGGRTIQKLATMAADGAVFGIDYASGSVAASRAGNARLIKDGRAFKYIGRQCRSCLFLITSLTS
jgi:SAM-dependent methyltransferase